MLDQVRYLLLQIRNQDDPMRVQEVQSFARSLHAKAEQIQIFDLLSEPLTPRHLEQADVFLLGGSGHYSATGDDPWLMRALESLRMLYVEAKPTFASCWGFQAMARAMGGTVVKDMSRAEIGTQSLTLTAAGRDDPLFGSLPNPFSAQMGHEDCVTELPPDAVLLASSEKVTNQAYRFKNRPIYCTQFHPELNCNDLMDRVRNYPEYIERIAGRTVEEFLDMIEETPESASLLPRFVEHSLTR